jgi:hypothetical protein
MAGINLYKIDLWYGCVKTGAQIQEEKRTDPVPLPGPVTAFNSRLFRILLVMVKRMTNR